MKLEISDPSDQLMPLQHIKTVLNHIQYSIYYIYNDSKMPHGKFTTMRCTLAFDSLSLGCFAAWLSIWLWSIRPTAMAWHDECCWWSHMAMPVGLGLIHMHKKQPRHFDRGLQVIKVVKIVVWYENPAWKGAGKQWLKTLVWPPQKILEMLTKKMKKIGKNTNAAV